MSFGIFEASITSEAEAAHARQQSADKFAAAIYDVREKLGPMLFASKNIEEFRHKVAMMKNDQSVYKIIGAHLHPATGTVRRIVGRGGELEKEFRALVATGVTADKQDYLKNMGWQTSQGSEDDSPSDHLPPTSDKKKKNSGKHDRWPSMGDPDYSNDDTHVTGEFGQMANPYVGEPPVMKRSPGAPTGPRGKHRAEGNRLACYPGCDKNEAHAKKFHNKDARRRRADFDGTQDLDTKFDGESLPDRGELVPKDNFDGYLSDVTGPETDKVQSRNFASKAAWAVYTDWCAANRTRPGLNSLDRYASNLSDTQYLRLARTIQAWEFSHQPKTPSGQSSSKLKDVTAAGRHEIPEGQGWNGYTTIGGEGKTTGEMQPYDSGYPKEPSYMKKGPGTPKPYGAHSPDPSGTAPNLGVYEEKTRPRSGRRDPLRAYIAWCDRNNLKRISARNVEYYSQGNPQLCVHLAQRMKAAIHTARRRQATEPGEAVDPTGGGGYDEWGNPPGLGADRIHEMRNNINEWNSTARRRHAAPDYLQKADDALTQLLNQKAEEFQETIAPLQQALVTVQQAQQLQQQNNPMNVLPPPGTVNVMPGGDQGEAGMPAAGAQDLGAAAQALAGPLGGAPAGGAPAPGGGEGAPPPAAAGGGLPPDLDQAAPQQTTARRRTASDVKSLWDKFQQQRGQSGNLGIGGDADYEQFAQQFKVGPRALDKLKKHHQQGVTVGSRGGGSGKGSARIAGEAKTPNIAEEAVKNQWRQMDSAMQGHGYKFDKGANAWTKPGHAPVRNHWQHTGGQLPYPDPDLKGTGWYPREIEKNMDFDHPYYYEEFAKDNKKHGGQHDYDPGNPNQIFAPARGHGWEHASGPSGPPYSRPQNDEDYEGHPLPHRHEAAEHQYTGPDSFGYYWDEEGNEHDPDEVKKPKKKGRRQAAQIPVHFDSAWDGYETAVPGVIMHDPPTMASAGSWGLAGEKPQSHYEFEQNHPNIRQENPYWPPQAYPSGSKTGPYYNHHKRQTDFGPQKMGHKQADLVDLMQKRDMAPGGQRHVAGWDWDHHLNGYTGSKPSHFACACGDSFPAPSGFHRCACGRQWNSYVIGTGGGSHEASADKFLVREIPVRPDVIVANNQMLGMDVNEGLQEFRNQQYKQYQNKRDQRIKTRTDQLKNEGYEPSHYHQQWSVPENHLSIGEERNPESGKFPWVQTPNPRFRGQPPISMQDVEDEPGSNWRQGPGTQSIMHEQETGQYKPPSDFTPLAAKTGTDWQQHFVDRHDELSAHPEGRPHSWEEFQDEYGMAPSHETGPPSDVRYPHLDPATGKPAKPGTTWASRKGMRKGAPFAGYEDFDDCTSKNSDKDDPSAYCGEIKHRTEDKKTAKTPTVLTNRWSQTGPDSWAHEDGGELHPSTDKEGHYQLWGPTVSFGQRGGDLAKLKSPHPDPKHLMDWYSWASGEGPKPSGVGFFGSVQLLDPRTGAMHTLIDPGELGAGEDAGTPTMKKPPKDWARRGDGAKWTKSPIGA